jgi:serine/threonine protein kinase
MTDAVPEKLGKQKIIEEVGRGGFAAVYKAVDTTLDRTVALKVLAPHPEEPDFCPIGIHLFTFVRGSTRWNANIS